MIHIARTIYLINAEHVLHRIKHTFTMNHASCAAEDPEKSRRERTFCPAFLDQTIVDDDFYTMPTLASLEGWMRWSVEEVKARLLIWQVSFLCSVKRKRFTNELPRDSQMVLMVVRGDSLLLIFKSSPWRFPSTPLLKSSRNISHRSISLIWLGFRLQSHSEPCE